MFIAILVNLVSIKLLSEPVLGIGGDNSLISLAVAVNVLAGMTGYASGGKSIALDTLGSLFGSF